MLEFTKHLLHTALGGAISGLFTAAIISIPILIKLIKKKKLQKSIQEKSSSAGLTPLEYAKKNVPESCIKNCEFYKGNRLEVQGYLDSQLKAKKITKEIRAILMEEYGQ